MVVTSKPNHSLFRIMLISFLLLAVIEMFVLFQRVFHFDQLIKGSILQMLAALWFVTFVAMPLWLFHKVTIRYIIRDKEIEVIDWFGFRRNIYSVESKNDLKIKWGLGGRYGNVKFEYLNVTTKQGRVLKIGKKGYKNFTELHIALRKAASKN